MSRKNKHGMPIQAPTYVQGGPAPTDSAWFTDPKNFHAPGSMILPSGHEFQVVKPGRGLAISGFVVSLVGCVFGLIPITFIMAWVCGVAGFVLALFGRRYKLGKAGIALGIVAIGLGIIGIIIVNGVFNSVGNSLDCLSTANTQAQINAC